ncbi:MAG: TonB-dependent receptor plug domain-containing protein [Ignavibacteria bacterium]|nr:TonB-dependent receptor plug domain-containing protein [Ignavibacteria bacterium]
MKFAFIIFVLILNINQLLSSDTIETKIKNEVIVQEEKDKPAGLNKLSYYKINLSKQRFFGTSSITEVLKTLPGVYLRDYGGIGGIKTISLRGFSSQDVTILLDECKINNQQNGVFDLTLIPIDIFEEIELFKGGSSFFWGNNSASGSLNFDISNSANKSFVKLSYGSFAQFSLSSIFSFKLKKFYSGKIAYNFFNSNGNYPIKINEFGITKEIKRQNSKISKTSLYFNNQFLTDYFLTNLNIIYTHSNRGVPGAVLQNNIENKKATLTDDFLFINLKFHPIFIDTNLYLVGKTIFSMNKYYDPEVNKLLLQKETAVYENKDFELRLNYNNYLLWNKINFMLETSYYFFKGDMLEKKEGNNIVRNNLGYGLSISKDFLYKEITYGYEINFRTDINSKFSPNYAYSIGLLLSNNSNTPSTKIMFSNNYRLPTFNEMYYLNYGNQNLRPEKTQSFNFEINFDLFNAIQPTFVIYYYTTIDKIVSVPKSPVQWTAMNITKSRSFGYEITLNSNNKYLEGTLSISYTNATDRTKNSPTFGKQIIYTPKIITNISISSPILKYLNIASKLIYVGERYSLPDNSPNSKLNNYILWDIVISKEISLKNFQIFISFEVLNILNKQYEVIFNYPMPGRSFSINLITNFL